MSDVHCESLINELVIWDNPEQSVTESNLELHYL